MLDMVSLEDEPMEITSLVKSISSTSSTAKCVTFETSEPRLGFRSTMGNTLAHLSTGFIVSSSRTSCSFRGLPESEETKQSFKRTGLLPSSSLELSTMDAKPDPMIFSHGSPDRRRKAALAWTIANGWHESAKSLWEVFKSRNEHAGLVKLSLGLRDFFCTIT